MTIELRKDTHLEICLRDAVTNLKKTAGFEDVKLIYNALPELDWEKVDTTTNFFGKKISAPIIIDAMTGGYDIAKIINKQLAVAAEEEQIPFALGSQRAMIEDKRLKDTYYVRDVAPTIPIIGNIGAVQLKEKGMIKKTEEAIKDIEADALAIHLNPLQEVVQPEGNKNFEGCLAAIEEACDTLDVPVIVKEVGAGISGEVAKKLEKAGIAAMNIAGAGGTAWGRVEVLRGGRLKRFEYSGIPTVCALMDVLRITKKPVIVSGGVRDGVDVAKGIALGASYAAAALPFLLAWKREKERETIKLWKEELKTTMFLISARNISELKKKRTVIIGKTAEYLRALIG